MTHGSNPDTYPNPLNWNHRPNSQECLQEITSYSVPEIELLFRGLARAVPRVSMPRTGRFVDWVVCTPWRVRLRVRLRLRLRLKLRLRVRLRLRLRLRLKLRLMRRLSLRLRPRLRDRCCAKHDLSMGGTLVSRTRVVNLLFASISGYATSSRGDNGE